MIFSAQFFKTAVAVPCFFNGATSEELIITSINGTTYSTTTSITGATETPIYLYPGLHTVTGGVSGYTRTVNIAEMGGTYNAYPDGAIFWFGNGDESNDTLWSKCGGFAGGTSYRPSTAGNPTYNADTTITKNTNDVYIKFSKSVAAWKIVNCEVHMVKSIDTTGYGKLNVVGEKKNGNLYTTSALSTAFPISGQSTSISNDILNPTSLTPDNYFIYHVMHQPETQSTVSTNVTIKALWLDDFDADDDTLFYNGAINSARGGGLNVPAISDGNIYYSSAINKGRCMAYTTKQTVDITNYSKLKLTFKNTGPSTTTGIYVRAFVTNLVSQPYNGTMLGTNYLSATKQQNSPTNNTVYTVELDISSLSGSYYLGYAIGVLSSAATDPITPVGYISKIELVP